MILAQLQLPRPGVCNGGWKAGTKRRAMGLLPSLRVSYSGDPSSWDLPWYWHLNQRPQGGTLILTSGRHPKNSVRCNSRLPCASLTSFLSFLSLGISEGRSSGSLLVFSGTVQREVFELHPQMGGSHHWIIYNLSGRDELPRGKRLGFVGFLSHFLTPILKPKVLQTRLCKPASAPLFFTS